MKTVQILVRGLALSSACLLFACSGTQAPDAENATGAFDPSFDPSLSAGSGLSDADLDAESGAAVSMPQDPDGTQDGQDVHQ